MSHQEGWPCVHFPEKIDSLALVAPLPLTFPFICFLISLETISTRLFPLKPLCLLVNPVGNAASLFERECLASPFFPHRVVNFMC